MIYCHKYVFVLLQIDAHYWGSKNWHAIFLNYNTYVLNMHSISITKPCPQVLLENGARVLLADTHKSN